MIGLMFSCKYFNKKSSCENIETRLLDNSKIEELDSSLNDGIVIKKGNSFVCSYEYFYHCENVMDDQFVQCVFVQIDDINKLSANRIYNFDSKGFTIYTQIAGAWIGPKQGSLISGRLKFLELTKNLITIDFVDTVKASFSLDTVVQKKMIAGKFDFKIRTK